VALLVVPPDPASATYSVPSGPNFKPRGPSKSDANTVPEGETWASLEAAVAKAIPARNAAIDVVLFK
jgi:hypothetical protein